jgi:hypothetical protein
VNSLNGLYQPGHRTYSQALDYNQPPASLRPEKLRVRSLEFESHQLKSSELNRLPYER